MKAIWKKTTGWYFSLTHRERVIVGAAAIGGFGYLIWMSLTVVQTKWYVPQTTLEARKREMMDIGSALHRYSQLSDRVKTLEAKYAESQMSFEQVAVELDKIVKDSIGSDNYEWKRNPAGRAIGTSLEQQDFTLQVRSLTLEQLVSLLYKLEHGGAALYLGKLEVNRAAGAAGSLTATLEVSSIGKRRTA